MFTTVHRADRRCAGAGQAYRLDQLHSDGGYQLRRCSAAGRDRSEASPLTRSKWRGPTNGIWHGRSAARLGTTPQNRRVRALGTELVSAVPSGEIMVRDATGRESRVGGDLVVGADGVHSTVRRHGNFGAHERRRKGS